MESVDVTVYNASEIVQHYQVSLLDFPPEWYTAEPAVTKLRPRETGTVQVQMRMPAEGGLHAGTYVLGALVTSPYDAEVSWCEELDLEVEPAPMLSATISPEMVTGGSDAHYQVTLANGGNIALDVVLDGSDAERKTACGFVPNRVVIEPGMAVVSQLHAHRPAPWVGNGATRAITVTADSEQGKAIAKATFQQKPTIPPGVFKTVGPIVGVTTLAGAVVLGARLISAAGDDDPAPDPTVAQSSAPGESTSAAASESEPTSESASASSSQPTTTSAPSTGSFTVDFSDLGEGRESGDVLLTSTRYAEEGIAIIAGVPELTDTVCAEANAVAQLTLDPPIGTFLTPALPDALRSCNSVPLKLGFEEPVDSVSLTYLGVFGDQYELRIEFADASPFATVPTTPTASLTPTVAEYTDGSGRGIIGVTLAPLPKDSRDLIGVLVKAITFTRS